MWGEFMKKIRRKNKKNKKATLKGMTLIEILIAMVVLAVLAAMVATAGMSIVSNMRTSKSVIEKVNYQSDYVARHDGTSATDIKISLASDEAGVNVVGNSISVKVFEAPEDADALYKNYDKAGNLKYFEHN